MKKLFPLLTLAFALIFLTFNDSFAQDGANDATFNPSDLGFGAGDGIGGANLSSDIKVLAIATQRDGKILIGGKFTSYNGIPVHNLVRTNIDGNLDTSFKAGQGVWMVENIAIQSDGKILAAGSFSGYSRLMRLNIDGSFDSTFSAAQTADDLVKTIAIQSDGKILIGGSFKDNLARLYPDGSRDQSFYYIHAVGSSKDHQVQSIAIQNDGRILVGGSFTTRNGAWLNNLVRLNLDGRPDFNFDSELSADAVINVVALQSDGKILIGGSFTSYDGVPRRKIARLDKSGRLDTTFISQFKLNESIARINTIAIDIHDKILVGAEDHYGPGTNRIGRLNNNGTIDTSFRQGIGVNSGVNVISIQGDGKILMGGYFTTYDGAQKNKLARLNSNGRLDKEFASGTGTNGPIRSLAVQKDGKILISGWFKLYNNFTRNGIARLKPDGSLDGSFDPSTTENDFVNHMALQDDGKVLIVRQTITQALHKKDETVRLKSNGSIDSSYNIGSINDVTLNSIAIQSDGKLLIGGDFYSSSNNNIARLTSNGSLDQTFLSPLKYNQTVSMLAPQSDGKIIIAGNFNVYTYPNWERVGIARLNSDGSFDPSFSTQASGVSNVKAIIIQLDGKILIGGGFSACNGIERNRIARLNKDGSLDRTFDPRTGANGDVHAIALQDDGKILIVGGFTSYDNVERNGIAKLNSDGSLDVNFNPGEGAGYLPLNDLTRHISAVAIQSDGKILIGGDFISYDGTGRNRIARSLWSTPITENANPLQENGIFISPNPSNGTVSLTSSYSEAKVEVYSSAGRKVYSTNILGKRTDLKLEHLQPGLYIIKLYHAEGVSIDKILLE
ncbi:MAG TPA: T9SS type A sorting domain-containing protein [Cytophagaceae bacterium]|jgi:uncharacterized delta-60 repeat protein